MPRLASTYSPDALPWCWVAQQDPPTTCNALPFAFAAGSRPPFCFRVCYWRSGVRLLWCRSSLTVTSEEQAATAGGTIESTALPDARSIEQREAGGSTGERQHSVGSVLALAHHGGAEWRWAPSPRWQRGGSHQSVSTWAAPLGRGASVGTPATQDPPRPSSSPPATLPSRRLPASVAMMCALRHQVKLPSA